MLLPIPEDVLQAQARERMLDALIGSLGVSVAAVSASFAVYMVAVGPTNRPAPKPAPLLAYAGVPTHAPRSVEPPVPPRDATASEPGDIDFDPTGSIASSEPQGSNAPSARSKAVLTDFAVRDVFDGTALVEAHGALHMVQPGATIEGAGKVLSVSRRGNGWVVATSDGLILQRR